MRHSKLEDQERILDTSQGGGIGEEISHTTAAWSFLFRFPGTSMPGVTWEEKDGKITVKYEMEELDEVTVEIITI